MTSCLIDRTQDVSKQIENRNLLFANRTMLNTSTTCTCMPQNNATNCTNNAPNQAINQFMGGFAVKNYTITWTNCVGGNNDPNCTYYQNSVKTKLKLCWADCYHINAEFDGKPPCLPCMPEKVCFTLNPQYYTQGGNSYYVLSAQIGNTIND